jgi:hypothetical protein
VYLEDAKARNDRIRSLLGYLSGPGEIVISDIPWFPQVTATLQPTRRIVFADSPREVFEIAEAAAQRGYRSISFVSLRQETGFDPPHNLVSSRQTCRYERNARLSMSERSLIFDRFNCQKP